jgi:hypothetical protein
MKTETFLKIMILVCFFGIVHLNMNSKNSNREVNSGKNIGDIGAFFSTNTDFSSVEQCIQYVRDNSLTMEKLKAGAISCRAIFYTDDNIDKKNKISKLGKCFIESFENIVDDASGMREISKCSKYPESIGFARAIAKNFSMAERVAEEQENQLFAIESAMERNNSLIQSVEPISNQPPAPFLIDDGGVIKNCIMIGVTMNCN